MSKKIHVEKIKFIFSPECDVCGTYNEWTKKGINIVDIISIGVSICQECGDDLDIKDTCELL